MFAAGNHSVTYLRGAHARCQSSSTDPFRQPAAALQRALAQQGQGFRELLLAGEPLREVARACGFAELSPFYPAFRRWYGQTPGLHGGR